MTLGLQRTGEALDIVVAFLERIGLVVERRELEDDTFLPGVRIEGGRLLVDESRLRQPGDLLHEAGHLALASPNERRELDGALTDDGCELGVIAWTWAATLELGLDPRVVFHSEGYRGGSADLIRIFREGGTPGVPLLEWRALTACPERTEVDEAYRFPRMRRWLREE